MQWNGSQRTTGVRRARRRHGAAQWWPCPCWPRRLRSGGAGKVRAARVGAAAATGIVGGLLAAAAAGTRDPLLRRAVRPARPGGTRRRGARTPALASRGPTPCRPAPRRDPGRADIEPDLAHRVRGPAASGCAGCRRRGTRARWERSRTRHTSRRGATGRRAPPAAPPRAPAPPPPGARPARAREPRGAVATRPIRSASPSSSSRRVATGAPSCSTHRWRVSGSRSRPSRSR